MTDWSEYATQNWLRARKDLMSARHIGDYGGLIHVSREEADDAIAVAEAVILAVHRLVPDSLPL
jgi:uncharacterized protein (UPF0332 family)